MIGRYCHTCSQSVAANSESSSSSLFSIRSKKRVDVGKRGEYSCFQAMPQGQTTVRLFIFTFFFLFLEGCWPPARHYSGGITILSHGQLLFFSAHSVCCYVLGTQLVHGLYWHVSDFSRNWSMTLLSDQTGFMKVTKQLSLMNTAEFHNYSYYY